MRATVVGIVLLVSTTCFAQAAEDAAYWTRQGRAYVAQAKRLAPVTGKAKNVILFVGDGMGISTITAARILHGQQQGRPGEEGLLSFERLPYAALVKTYNTNQQVSDSAGTMTAMVTGVKTKAGVLSVGPGAGRGDAASGRAHSLPTIFEIAERHGLATGIVTTTRVTHATPAACYAHSPERYWESDVDLPSGATAIGFPDIARQLIEFDAGDGLEVVFGGGRRAFLPMSTPDPEGENNFGRRGDGRDLTSEWAAKPSAAYIWNKQQFDALDVKQTRHVLGLFDHSHMEYEHDRTSDAAGEPSLSEMTAKAIDMLSQHDKGYLLMVEGGRIDHAHHETNAYRALTDTIEFANAVAVARKKTNRNDTLIVVTADHSHVFTMAGYSSRGHPILGKVNQNNMQGEPTSELMKDSRGRPFTTLGYANGPGYVDERGRPDLTEIDTTDPQYVQEATVPLASETHGGEDVPLYADGPQAHLFHGVMEQNVIFHVMMEALGMASQDR